MTPDEHAARAVDMADKAASTEGPWTSEQRVRMGLHALTHAVLALRPEPSVPQPIVTGLPTGRCAVVRATVQGERLLLCRYAEDPADSLPWRHDGSGWWADHDLTDVEVLFPGVPS